jgi:membrane associated rhomboid family serine protease
MAGTGSLWVIDLLRLVRPVLTFSLIVLVGMLYFSADMGGRATIEASVIYMCSSAVLWWFGDRAMRKKK